VSRGHGLSREALHSGQWLDLPVRVQLENTIEVLITPSPPSDGCLSPPFAPGQKGTHLHLRVVAHFAEVAAGVADSEVVDPTGKRGVDLLHHLRHRGRSAVLDDVAHLGLDCLAGFLLRSHLDVKAVPFPHSEQVKSQESEGLPLQHVHYSRLLPVHLQAEGRDLLLEPLQGTLCPAPLAVVAADGDAHIISESMIVHCLIWSLYRFAAYRVEGPVHVFQVDVRGQRARAELELL